MAAGYDRYFFSLRSPKALPGWAAFDGNKLREMRERETDDLSDYQGILEGNGIFYVPRPAMPGLLAKIDTLATSVRIAIPTIIQKTRESLGKPRMFCRNATIHRNSWGAVLRGDVVFEGLDGQEIVRAIRK